MTVPLFTPLFRESYNLCKPPVIGSYSTPFKAGVGRHFDPRSPRGERRLAARYSGYGTTFLSTLPARGATGSQPVNIPLGDISIHAPREGSDPRLVSVFAGH